MALKIPFYRPVARPRYSSFSPDTARGEGIDISPLTDAIAQLANVWTSQLEEDRAVKYRSAVGQAAIDLRRTAFEMAADGDPATRVDRFLKAKDELRDNYLKKLDEEGIGGTDKFTQEFDLSALGEEFDLRKASSVELTQQQEGTFERTLDNYTKLAGEGTAEQQQQFRDMGVLAIEDSVRGGIISPMEGVKRERKFVADIVETRVRRDILADPHEAERRLLAGDYADLEPDNEVRLLEKAGGIVERLDRRATALDEKRERLAERADRQAIALEEKRGRLLERASRAAEAEERRRVAAEDRGIRLSEKADRQVADALQKEGDRLNATGELTPSWIEANREELAPDDYRHFYKQLEPGTSDVSNKTDATIYVGLRQTAAEGMPVKGPARDAYLAGLIKREDYDRLVQMEEEGTSKTSGWLKTGESYISTALRTSDVNPDPAAPQRLANTLDEWREYARTHPDIGPEEARKVYRQMVSETSLVNFGEVLGQMKSSPDVAVVKRPEDLDQAENALFEEFLAKHGGDDAKMMADPDFMKRAAELDRLRQAAPPAEEAAGGAR